MTRRGPNETTDAMHARLSTQSFAPFPVEVLDLAGDAERWAAGLYAPQVSASERAEVVAAIAAAIVKGQALAAPEVVEDVGLELWFTYRNWRGEVGRRRVLASSVRMSWGSTEWHPEPQMLMTAVDLDKHAMRAFAWKDIVHGGAAEAAKSIGALKALVDIVSSECLSMDTQSDPDEDSVGWTGDGKPLPMTFGHIRRANRALGHLTALFGSSDKPFFGPLSEILHDWTIEEQRSAAGCLAHALGMVLQPAPLPDTQTIKTPETNHYGFAHDPHDQSREDALSEPTSSALDFLNAPSEPMAADDVRLTGSVSDIELPKVLPSYEKPIA